MRLPLLLYHDIRPDSFNLLSVSSELKPYILHKSDFINQLEWLHNNRYDVITLEKLVELRGKLDNKTVCIVFDDGQASNYDITYPLLKKYGFKATFFITIENIGRQEMMSWAQIKELSDSGMSIGSHNLTHRIPVGLSDRELEYELKESKRILEEKLNKRIEFFSSPTGFYDKRIERLAKEIGYKGVCFSRVSFNKFNNNNYDFLCLKKIGIKRGYNLETFKNIVEGKRDVLISLRLRQILRNMAKSLLGPRKYIQLKSFVLRKHLRLLHPFGARNDGGR